MEGWQDLVTDQTQAGRPGRDAEPGQKSRAGETAGLPLAESGTKEGTGLQER